MYNFKKGVSNNLLNIPGWRTNRRIVVIESDDWGTIRMASKKSYDFFLKNRLPVDKCAYNTNDALECNEDLEQLFEALSSVSDLNNNPAVITANNIVANPDFEKIKASDFQGYFFEPFTETLKRYPEHDNVADLYKTGIENKLFMPQFHGREHVNIARWLKSLQEGEKPTHLAFEQSMFSVHTQGKTGGANEFMDALDVDSLEELNDKKGEIAEGLELFKTIWGFASKSFIAPCYTWSSFLEPVLSRNGIKYIQGIVIQSDPTMAEGFHYKKKYHYQGQQNKEGQHYLIRNAFFEPSTNPTFDWVGDCLHRIEIAFRWHKPAIISAHRVNFVGFLNPQNRSENLMLLRKLLKKIKQRWPDVEFLSSDQLGDLIEKNN